MININGKIYSGNVTIVNGQVISGDLYEDTSSKKFDETKRESANGVKRITIESSVKVNVTACNTTKDITAHLHGSAITNGDIKLSMIKNGDEVYLSAETVGNSINYNNMSIFGESSIVINRSSYGSGLVLDIQIPNKPLEKISVECKNSSINIQSPVTANTITVNSKSGNVNVSAIFQALTVDCKNGNIKVQSEAYCDVILNIASKNGNADVSIGDIANSKVSVDSKNGSCKNSPSLNGRYTASGNVTSKNGNVKFH